MLPEFRGIYDFSYGTHHGNQIPGTRQHKDLAEGSSGNYLSHAIGTPESTATFSPRPRWVERPQKFGLGV